MDTRMEKQKLAEEEKVNETTRFNNRPNIEQYKKALSILGLGYFRQKTAHQNGQARTLNAS